jgi:biopolymer transport protein TolR
MNVPIKSVKRRPIAEINVVPYIDVMLVLLVIFMMTTPLLSQGVNVDLPQAKAKPLTPKDKEPLIVSVDAQGNYYLNIAENPSQPLDPQAISQRVQSELANAKQQGQEQPVFVKGDNRVNYGKIMTAMVLLQQAGAKSVGLITEPPVERN